MLTIGTGKIFASSTPSAKKLARQSLNRWAIKVSTRPSWTKNSKLYNKKNSTTRCSRRVKCLLPTRSVNYLPRQKESKARRPQEQRKKTRKKNSGNYKQKWRCDYQLNYDFFLSPTYPYTIICWRLVDGAALRSLVGMTGFALKGC